MSLPCCMHGRALVHSGYPNPWLINPLPLIGIVMGILLLRPFKGGGLLIMGLHDPLGVCNTVWSGKEMLSHNFADAAVAREECDSSTEKNMGGCQIYGPIRCRIIIGTQKATIILTTTRMFLKKLRCGICFAVPARPPFLRPKHQ